MNESRATLHATCVALAEAGLLLLGDSGAGKSALALRLIDAAGRGLGPDPLPARLVADDRVIVTRRGDALFARAPKTSHGLMEVRGVGIMRLPEANLSQEARLEAVIRLTPVDAIARLPDVNESESILGVDLPLLRLNAADPAAPARLRAWLTARRFG